MVLPARPFHQPTSEASLSAKYLITGGAGFIGAAVAHALVERRHSVVVLDSGAAAGFGYLDGLKVRLVRGDIRDRRAVSDAVADCEYIVHLAAQASVPSSIAAPLEDLDVNVVATVNLLEAARAAGVRRVVFGSSNAVVGGHPPPVSEMLTPRPVSPYGASKAAAEAYLRAYHEAYGLETVAIRFANAYGPWSRHKNSVVAAFIKAYVAGRPLTIAGDGRQTRDFIHVRDIAVIVARCLEAPAETVSGQIFQAGSGGETSLLELATVLFEVGGGDVPIVYGEPSAGDVPRNYSDVSKVRRVLGFEPAIQLRSGIWDTLSWYRTSEGR